MKIAILDDYQDVVRQLRCFDLLKEHDVKVFQHSASGAGQLAIRLAPFDAVVLIRERTRLTRTVLNKLPNLKLISQTGKVSGNIDVDAARELGIAIAEGVGDPTAPAELTWALIMAASRRIPNYANLLQQGLWQSSAIRPELNGLGRVLKGRRLGIWGYGKIGKLIAGYARAFGMPVWIWGSEAGRLRAQADGLETAPDRRTFFAESDVVTLHLRLNEQTRHIVTTADLQAMKSDALLVNTSRAELIAPGALLTALDAGHPGFAALDVFETEPLPLQDALMRRENVLLTPHLGYVEQDSYELYFRAAFSNILAFAAGQPENLLTPAGR